jgi:type IV pilus assembly protein PilO
MRMSEREKKYVALLIIMVFVAALYFYYTKAVEPFLLERSNLQIQRVQMEDLERLQQAKINSLGDVQAKVEEKAKEAMEVVEPFFSGLPQDQLLMQTQQLIQQSGVIASAIEFSPVTVYYPGVTGEQQAIPSIRLAELAEKASGDNMQMDEPTADENQSQGETSNEESVPNGAYQFSMKIEVQGNHENLASFIRLLEATNKSVAVSSLSETMAETGIISGTININYYAVPKPAEDDYFDWSYASPTGKMEMFQQQYGVMPEMETPVTETP